MPDDVKQIIQQVQGMATGAAAPERKEVGPGDVGPTVQGKASAASGGQAGPVQLVTLKMDGAEITKWWARIRRAEARVKARETMWDILLREYLPTVSASGAAETVRVMGHFRNVHSKIGQLFYRSPDLILMPKDPSPAQNQMPNPLQAVNPGQPLPPITMEDIISVKQAVLTEKLGRDGIKVSRLMDELLFDVMAWAGFGASKTGYRCVSKPIQEPVMQPDPTYVAPPPAPGSILGLGQQPQVPQVPVIDPQTGQPQMRTVMVPIHEEYYCRRFSPKKALWNDDLKSTRYEEDSTWKGMIFFMSPNQAMLPPERGGFGLTEAESSKAAIDDRVHEYPEDKQGDTKPPGLIKGYEVWCKASVFTDEYHPLAYNQLVMIEGIEDKVFVWRPSPDQEFDAQGKLTKDSLIGSPIQILTIRDLADSSFPPADSAFTNSIIKQLSTWRRQSVRIRDAAIGKYFYDSGAFEDSEIDLLKNGEVGSFIGVKDGLLANGAETIFVATAQIHATADDVRGQEILKQDMDETLGISSWGAGVPQDTVRTATEVASVQTAIAGRNDKELSRSVDYYLDIARMIDQLLMRYADQNEYIAITGTDGAQRMMLWNKDIVSGRYLYDIAPDSQMRVDTARDFEQTLNLYNLAAPDPLFNRAYVLRRLARMRNLDPSKVVLMGDQQMMQPPHGGTSQGGDAVNKHEASNSGGKPNAPGAVNKRQAPAA